MQYANPLILICMVALLGAAPSYYSAHAHKRKNRRVNLLEVPGQLSMDPQIIQEMLDSGSTYAQISFELKRRNGQNSRGLSKRSVRRFVEQNDLRITIRTNREQAVEDAIREVR